jgi:hypothetical protein
LETVYGEGKSKNARIQETFKQNPKLLEIIRHVLSDPLHLAPVLQDHSMNEAFTAAYARQSPEKIIDHIVELRGFLHHHSIRRPGIWHPEDDKRFKIDAFVLERVAFETVFEIARPHVFSDAAVAAYAAVVRQAEVNGTVSRVQHSETGPMDESG